MNEHGVVDDREPKPHPVRQALLELMARRGVITATDAARELGGSTGLYSFHLRSLARFGLIEESPAEGGKARPWRLVTGDRAVVTERTEAEAGDGLGLLARGLEDESYSRWLEGKARAPARWRRDESFSQVVYLTPEEMAGMAEVVKALIAQFRHRETDRSSRPADAAAVAVLARLFPLLEFEAEDRS
ncbi:ArsR family transcriptional regulator [Actinocorallia libanotica]|uniref:ArsR family transcriptional regulator n=1 Tax=Actinocorallia libanotica TaxID=46162 RepID=UPI0031D7FDC0